MVPCKWQIVEAFVTLYVLLDAKLSRFLHLSCSLTHVLLVTAFNGIVYAVYAGYAKGIDCCDK